MKTGQSRFIFSLLVFILLFFGTFVYYRVIKIDTKSNTASVLSALDRTKIPTFIIKSLSQVETVFDGNAGNQNYSAWEGDKKIFQKYDSAYVFLMDGSAYSVLSTGWPMVVFANFRCYGQNLTFNKSPTIISDAVYGNKDSTNNSWCQRLFFDSYSTPISSLNPWALGTRATWSAHSATVNNIPETVFINFTENKSTKGLDSIIRRGQGDAAINGYTKYKMDGTPNDTKSFTEGSLSDGFYQGFITSAFVNESTSTNHGANTLATDVGPVIWPVAGYRSWNTIKNAWQQTSLGVRHPRGFVDNGYLYVFYLEHGETRDGKNLAGNGIYVARALLSSGVTPGSFMCGKNFTENCLPKGWSGWFDKKTGLASTTEFEKDLGLPGPQVSSIIPGDTILNFSVAKIKGTNLYAGVESDLSANQISDSIRISTDLVNWSAPVQVPNTQFSTSYAAWNLNGLVFPRFADAITGSAELIDPNNFYLVGDSGTDSKQQACRDSWQCRLLRINVQLNINSNNNNTPTPTPVVITPIISTSTTTPTVPIALVIKRTARNSSKDSSSGFYACGTGFGDNVNASVLWTSPSGKQDAQPYWYLKMGNPPFNISTYFDSNLNLECAFIPFDAKTQSATFGTGWKATFTLYNTDNSQNKTVDMTPSGLITNPINS